jgi:hypothetical protein
MPDNFELIFFGDNQEGNIASSREKFMECIDYICAGKNRYGIHMGDACDAFWIDDPRYHNITTTATPIAQRKSVVKMMAPLVKFRKLITILKGNHEHALERKVGEFAEEMCEMLRAFNPKGYTGSWPLFGGFIHKLELFSNSGSPMFKVWVTHGRQTISSVSPDVHRRKAYMQFRLKRLMENKVGDAVVQVRGHNHLLLVTPPLPQLYLTTEKGKIKQHYTHTDNGSAKSYDYIPPEYRWFGCSGSFLRSQMTGEDLYSELAEYDPVELGYLRGIVSDRRFVKLEEVRV